MVAAPGFPFSEHRLPPQAIDLDFSQVDTSVLDIDSEDEIIGNILLHGDEIIEKVAEKLPFEAFKLTSNRLIYSIALKLKEYGESINIATVKRYIESQKIEDNFGTKLKLFSLADRAAFTFDLNPRIQSVLDCYLRRQLIAKAKEIVKVAATKDTPLSDVLEVAEAKVTEVTEYRHHALSSFRKAKDEVQLSQLTRDIENLEQETNPFERDFKIKKLREKWGFRQEKDFLNLHAKWLMVKQEEKSLSLVDYFNQNAGKNISWLLDTWIPSNSVTIVHGLGATGKTQFISGLTQALITGNSWSGYEVNKPIRVLWIQSDQGSVVTTMLLDRQGFFSLSTPIQERQHILHKWQIEQYHILEKELKENKFDLVIIDSLHSVSSGLCFKENEQEFARPLIRLRHIAEKYNVSFLIIAHSSKQGDLRGASALFNSADQVWKLEKVSDPVQRLTNLTIQKSRYRESDKRYRLQFDPETFSWICTGEITGMGEAEEINEPIHPIINEIKKFLRNNLGTPFKAVEIAERLQLNENTCRSKYLPQAVNMGLISSFRGRRNTCIYYAGDLGSEFSKVGNPESDRPDLADPDPDRPDLADPPDPKCLDQVVSLTQQDFSRPDPPDPQKIDQDQNLIGSGGSGGSGRSGRSGGSGGSIDSLPEDESINVGDLVESLYDGRQGVVQAIREQHRGSPKEPFTVYFATVSWSDGLRSDEHFEYLKRIEAPATADEPDEGTNPEPISNDQSQKIHWKVGDRLILPDDSGPKPLPGEIIRQEASYWIIQWANGNTMHYSNEDLAQMKAKRFRGTLTAVADEAADEKVSLSADETTALVYDPKVPRGNRKKFKVGDRVIHKEGTTAATVVEVEPKLMIRYDHTDKDACQFPSNMRFLEPHEDPKIIAKNLFETLKGNARIKSKPHKLHKKDNPGGRVGNVYETFERGGCYWVRMMHSSGFIDYCLEAIEVID